MFTNELFPGESGTRGSGRFLLVLVVLVQGTAGGPERGAFLAADDGAARPSDHRALKLAVLLGRSLLRSRALCLGLFGGESSAGRRGE